MTAVASSSSPAYAAVGSAAEIVQLALERFDVFLVHFDRVLIRLQTLEHLGVVLLVPGADGLLLGELSFRIREHGFFLRELALERGPLASLCGRAILLGETGWGFRAGVGRAAARRPDRRHRHTLFTDDAAILVRRVGFLVRQHRAA